MIDPRKLYVPAFAAPDPYEVDCDTSPIDRAREIRLPEFVGIRSKRGALLEIAKRETGMTVPAEVAAKAESECTLLLQQSRRVVDNLRVGFEAIDAELRDAIEHRNQGERDAMTAAARRWRKLAGPAARQWRLSRPSGEYKRTSDFEVVTYFVHSEHRIVEPQFRRSLIIPHVAKSVRVPVLTALESYLERHPFARMWTFTGGRRVRLSELRPAMAAFHRRINRLSKWLNDQFGIEMVFRGTELGTPEFAAQTEAGSSLQLCDEETGEPMVTAQTGGLIEFDETGEPLLHLHAHTVVNPSFRRNRASWRNVIRRVWSYWGHHWDAGKIVGKPREACKYMTKPGEMLRLQPKHLASLAIQLRRMKIVQPMGTLAKEIREREEKQLRLDRAPTREGRVFREVPDWNKRSAKTEAERELKAALEMGNRGSVPDCRIMSIGAPRFAPGSIIKEPCVTVLCSGNFDTRAVRSHPLVARLIAETFDQYRAGLALSAVCGAAGSIRVHTCTPTGRGGDGPEPPGEGVKPLATFGDCKNR